MILAVTYFRLRAPWLALPFLGASLRAARQAAGADGGRGGMIGADGLTHFWTLTGWDGETAIAAYRDADPHRTLMALLPRWASRSAFAHWEAEDWPTWRQAHAGLAERGHALPPPRRPATLRIVPGAGLRPYMLRRGSSESRSASPMT